MVCWGIAIAAVIGASTFPMRECGGSRVRARMRSYDPNTGKCECEDVP